MRCVASGLAAFRGMAAHWVKRCMAADYLPKAKVHSEVSYLYSLGTAKQSPSRLLDIRTIQRGRNRAHVRNLSPQEVH
jgi:hypothetical protein